MPRTISSHAGPLTARVVALCAGFLPLAVHAADAPMTGSVPNLTRTSFGFAALVIFLIAYGLVIAEEFIHLRKSKSVLVAAGGC